jgi:hypothetical protein
MLANNFSSLKNTDMGNFGEIALQINISLSIY